MLFLRQNFAIKQQKKQAEVLPTTEAVQDDAVEGCNDYATDGSLPLSTFRQKAHKNVVVRKRSQGSFLLWSASFPNNVYSESDYIPRVSLGILT